MLKTAVIMLSVLLILSLWGGEASVAQEDWVSYEEMDADSDGIQDIVVSTSQLKLVFTTEGARIKQLYLNKLRSDLISKPPLEKGETVDSTKPQDKYWNSYPLGIWLGDGKWPGELYKAIFDYKIERPAPKQFRIVFSYLIGEKQEAREDIEVKRIGEEHEAFENPIQTDDEAYEGLKVSKSFTINKGSYIMDLEVKITNTTAEEIVLSGGGDTPFGYRLEWGPGVGSKPQSIQPEVMIGDSRITKDDLNIPGYNSGDVRWSSLSGSGKIAAFIPQNFQVLSFVERDIANWGWRMGLATLPFTLPARGSVTHHYRIYGGPKELVRLVSEGLESLNLMQPNFWGTLTIYLLRALEFIYSITKNYGWSIIILTLLFRLLMWPLMKQQSTSMAAQKELQPKIEELKKKYGKNQQKLNKEMMALYKKQGINPMGGCLPLLIQMPIFFMMFRLFSSYKFDDGGFLWIKDLSAPDPYYILVVLVGVSMIWQQLSMSGADSAQSKQMLFMPLIFIFIMISMPAGVVLYWFISTLVSILQQYLTQPRMAVAMKGDEKSGKKH